MQWETGFILLTAAYMSTIQRECVVIFTWQNGYANAPLSYVMRTLSVWLLCILFLYSRILCKNHINGNEKKDITHISKK